MPKKQNTDKTLEDFLSKHDAQTTDYEEVETLNLERDALHAVTIHNHHTFDGKYGPATVVTYENDEGKFKTYLSGFEVTHFNNFIVGKDLPLKVQLARVQQDSASNEGRAYNRLVIETL